MNRITFKLAHHHREVRFWLVAWSKIGFCLLYRHRLCLRFWHIHHRHWHTHYWHSTLLMHRKWHPHWSWLRHSFIRSGLRHGSPLHLLSKRFWHLRLLLATHHYLIIFLHHLLRTQFRVFIMSNFRHTWILLFNKSWWCSLWFVFWSRIIYCICHFFISFFFPLSSSLFYLETFIINGRLGATFLFLFLFFLFFLWLWYFLFHYNWLYGFWNLFLLILRTFKTICIFLMKRWKIEIIFCSDSSRKFIINFSSNRFFLRWNILCSILLLIQYRFQSYNFLFFLRLWFKEFLCWHKLFFSTFTSSFLFSHDYN